MQPLVSLIIPAYNAERTVAAAIECALAQTYEPIEIIVVNDGSTDATSEVCAQFGERIRLIEQANAGAGAARNAGIAAAQGEFVSFLDADDVITPDKHAWLMPALVAAPQAVGATGWYEYRTETTQREHCLTAADDGALMNVFRLRMLPVMNTNTVLIRTEALRRVGGFRTDLRLGQDAELWVRLAPLGPWVYVHRCISTYIHTANTSRTRNNPHHNSRPSTEAILDLAATLPPELMPDYRRYTQRMALSAAAMGMALNDEALVRKGFAASQKAALLQQPLVWGFRLALRMINCLPAAARAATIKAIYRRVF